MREAKVAECIYPDRPCRGCSQSYNPARYDGGCMLHSGGGAKSLEALELETAAQPRTNYRKLDRGAIEPKTLDTACFLPLQSPYFIGFSGAKGDL